MAMNINIEDILGKNANNFYRFYHRDILYRADDADFQKFIDVQIFSVYTSPCILLNSSCDL